MEKRKLKDIATLRTGIVVNRYKSNTGNFNYKLLNLNSVKKNQINTALFDEILLEKAIDTKYLLKKGDIIMKVAEPYTTAVVDFEDKNVIAPSSFVIIRTKEDVNPRYVSYYLNSRNIKRQLNKYVGGSSLKIIRLSDLKELRINFIEKSRENDYLELLDLLVERRKLTEEKMEIEDKIFEYYLDYY